MSELRRNFLARLAAVAGASLVGYLPAGAGAATRTVQDKLRDTASPFDFMTGAQQADALSGAPVLDHTAALQAAINATVNLTPVAGATYLINTTLSVPGGRNLDFTGSSLKAGNAKTGLLDSLGIHFDFTGDASSRLVGLSIKPSATAFTLGGSGFVCAVRLNGSSYNVVRGCSIDLTGNNIPDGINVTGAADYNQIVDNNLTACGIRYSDGGARFTVARGNSIINAVQNGMSGSGTSNTREGYGCVLDSNRIAAPARMGIEDYMQVASGNILRGTRIVNNTIIGGAAATYFGISAVAYGAVISGNEILNWPNGYAIEVAQSYGTIITRNNIAWTNGNAAGVTGIQANITTDAYKVAPNIITENMFSGAGDAIRLQNTGQTVIKGNTFYGCKQIIVGLVEGTQYVASGNFIHVTTQTAATRTQIQAWSNCVIANNSILYESGFDGGTAGSDKTIIVTGSNTVVQGNLINGNGYKTNAVSPLGFSSNGATGSGVRFLNNILIGGVTASYQFFTDLVAENNVCASISSVSNGKNRSMTAKARNRSQP